MPDLRDGSSVEDIRLDRLPDFDQRSRNHPVCAALSPAEQKAPVSKQWTIPAGSPVLDQGVEGACVGFGITNDMRFSPVPVKGLDADFARTKIYWPAQQADPWEGGSYPGANPRYDGTSVRAGIKVAVELGYYGQYRWAFSEPEMALGVSHLGPAVIGVNWYSGMYRPNPAGYITVTGNRVGGHCILVKGINVRTGHYVVYNSWGPSWGIAGTAKISRAGMATLLAEEGECALITERFTGKNL